MQEIVHLIAVLIPILGFIIGYVLHKKNIHPPFL